MYIMKKNETNNTTMANVKDVGDISNTNAMKENFRRSFI